MIVTIDGPVASGKTTVARKVAHSLSWMYIYSGMLYRALAYVLVEEYHADEIQLRAPAQENIDAIFSVLRYEYTAATGASIVYRDSNITSHLKTASVDRAASLVSADPAVRHAVVLLQRKLAAGHDVIADGRDCGTVVFPQAELKLFLTAPLAVRAERWQRDQARSGHVVTLEEAQVAVAERDARDTGREHSPLVCAVDGVCIDTATSSAEDIAAMIIQRVSSLL